MDTSCTRKYTQENFSIPPGLTPKQYIWAKSRLRLCWCYRLCVTNKREPRIGENPKQRLRRNTNKGKKIAELCKKGSFIRMSNDFFQFLSGKFAFLFFKLVFLFFNLKFLSFQFAFLSFQFQFLSGKFAFLSVDFKFLSGKFEGQTFRFEFLSFNF